MRSLFIFSIVCCQIFTMPSHFLRALILLSSKRAASWRLTIFLFKNPHLDPSFYARQTNTLFVIGTTFKWHSSQAVNLSYLESLVIMLSRLSITPSLFCLDDQRRRICLGKMCLLGGLDSINWAAEINFRGNLLISLDIDKDQLIRTR